MNAFYDDKGEITNDEAKKHLPLETQARLKTDASNNVVNNQPDGGCVNAAQAAPNQIGLANKLFGRGENLLPGLIGHKVRPAVKYA
jgi:hypothetical protein